MLWLSNVGSFKCSSIKLGKVRHDFIELLEQSISATYTNQPTLIKLAVDGTEISKSNPSSSVSCISRMAYTSNKSLVIDVITSFYTEGMIAAHVCTWPETHLH
jgi:hypothetical protein